MNLKKKFQKFLLFLLLLMLTSSSFLHATGPTHNKKVVCYFSEWGVYGRSYFVKDIPADKLTHLNFSFLFPFIVETSKIQTNYIFNSSIYAKAILPEDCNVSSGKTLKQHATDQGNTPQPLLILSSVALSNGYTIGIGMADPWACIQITSFTRRYNSSAVYNNNIVDIDIIERWNKTGTNWSVNPAVATNTHQQIKHLVFLANYELSKQHILI